MTGIVTAVQEAVQFVDSDAIAIRQHFEGLPPRRDVIIGQFT